MNSFSGVNIVMLIDDNDTDNFVHAKIIENSNFARNIMVHSSGRSALEYLELHKDNIENIPDLIFLDLSMPVVDGFLFLFEFDNFSQELKNKCKIVILSSSESKRDKDRIVDKETVISYIHKPLTPDALERVKLLLH